MDWVDHRLRHASRSNLEEVQNESSARSARRARGGGHADRCCGGGPRPSEATRGDRHEAVAAENVRAHPAGGRPTKAGHGHDQPRLAEYLRTRGDARRPESHDLQRRSYNTTGRLGTLTIRDRNEWVDLARDRNGDGENDRIAVTTWESCEGPASTPESSGRGEVPT